MVKAPSIEQQITQIQQDISDLQGGLYAASLGPGTITNAVLRPKSVISSTIDVSTLQSVQTNTGDLSVTGNVGMTTGGSFSAGQTAYNTGTGWYLDYNGGTPRMSIGSSSNYLTWDGSSLTISGALSAATGSFSGSITSSSGTIGGWTINSANLAADNVLLQSSGTISSGATSFSTGTGWWMSYNSGTPQFRVGTATTGTNYLSFDGSNIVMRGKLIFGSGGNSYLDSSIMHFEVASSSADQIEFKNSTNTAYGLVSASADSAGAAIGMGALSPVNSSYQGQVVFSSSTGTTDGSNVAQIQAQPYASSSGAGALYQAFGTGGHFWKSNSLSIMGANSTNGLQMYAKFYPGTGTGQQSTGYIDWNSTFAAIRMVGGPLQLAWGLFPGNGGTAQTTRSLNDDGSNLRLNTSTPHITGSSSAAGIQWDAVANGGSATNWSTNAPTGAAYLKINIAGTNYRLAFWADG